MKRYTTRNIPAVALELRNPFTTGGALDGIDYAPTYRGYLRGHALRAYDADRAQIDFVVRSYGTPIAWHTPAGWKRVVDHFSATTGKHQLALNFPTSEPVYPVGFSFTGLSDTQVDVLLSLKPGEYVTPKGQAKRTFAALQSRGLVAQDGFNPGEYRINNSVAERIAP